VESYPRVDGALSAQTLASAYQDAFTGESSSQVFSGTDLAYTKLISGNTDLIIVPVPTPAQLALAQNAGMELEVIPVANDALVFLAQADAVNSVGVDNLRAIYGGATTDWASLGSSLGPITAYQNLEDWGSSQALMDLVMNGSPLAPAPKDSDGNPLVYDGQQGGIGYAFYHYVKAIWGDLVDPRDGGDSKIKLLDVNNISANPVSIQSSVYPLTTPYFIVINKAQRPSSKVRVLIEAMLGPTGHEAAIKAGYIPRPPATVTKPEPGATPAQDPNRLENLNQVYSLNPLAISTATIYFQAWLPTGNTGCAMVESLEITGLKNPNRLKDQLTAFTEAQLDYLKDVWEVENIVQVESCTGVKSENIISLRTSLMANFANLLSVVSRTSEAAETTATIPVASMNLRLDTAAPLALADLFTQDANIAAMIHVADSTPRKEEAVVAWASSVDTYPFSFTPMAAQLYLPAVAGEPAMELTIPFRTHWSELALFNLAQTTGLYTSTSPATTCPVLTYRMDNYCWTGEDKTWPVVDAPHEGGIMSVPLEVAPGFMWRVRSSEASDPKPMSGTGPMTIDVGLAGNPSETPRVLRIEIEVHDPQTEIAYNAHIDLKQAGKPLEQSESQLTDNSTLTIESGPVRVVVPPCSGVIDVSDEVVIASVTALDIAGQPRPNTRVQFFSAGGLILGQSIIVTDEFGIASIAGVLDPDALAAGARPSVSAFVESEGTWVNVTGSSMDVDLELIAEPDPPGVLTLNSSASTGAHADGRSSYAVSAHLVDGCGVLGAGQMIEFTATGSAQLSEDTIQLDAEGRAHVLVTNLVPETITFGAKVLAAQEGEVEIKPLTMRFEPPVPDIFQSALIVNSMVNIPCTGEGVAPVSVVVKDGDGDALLGQEIAFSVEGRATLSDSTVRTDSTGIGSITLISSEEETVILRATMDGKEISGSPVVVSFLPDCSRPAPASMWYSLSAGPRVADGVDGFLLTVYAKDVNGGYVGGMQEKIKIISSDSHVTIAEVTESGYGVYTTRITATKDGIFDLGIFLAGDDFDREVAKSPTEVVFVPAWSSHLTAQEDSSEGSLTKTIARVADGQDTLTITAQITSRAGTSPSVPLVGQASTLSASIESSAGGVIVTPFIEVRPGVYTADITSTIPGVYQATITWTGSADGAITTDPVPVTFVPIGFDRKQGFEPR
jgi:phosphate transport system substrate-binding protein